VGLGTSTKPDDPNRGRKPDEKYSLITHKVLKQVRSESMKQNREFKSMICVNFKCVFMKRMK
jgi:hypothetical protein